MTTQKKFIEALTAAERQKAKITVSAPIPTGPNGEDGRPTFRDPVDFEGPVNQYADKCAELFGPVLYDLIQQKATEIAENISKSNNAKIIERLEALKLEVTELKQRLGII